MLLLCSCMFHPKHKHIYIRPPIPSGVPIDCGGAALHQSISTFFSGKEICKWDILPSSIYTTDNDDSMTLLPTGHLSYSSTTTHCNHSIRMFYIGDPTLTSSMFQIFISVLFVILFCLHLKYLNWITLTLLKAIAQDKLVIIIFI